MDLRWTFWSSATENRRPGCSATGSRTRCACPSPCGPPCPLRAPSHGAPDLDIVSSVYCLLIDFLPVENVAQQPPDEHHCKKEPDEQWSIQAGIQSRVASATALGKQAQGYPGYGNQQQRIIPECSRQIAMQQRVNSTLTAATRTFITREREESATRKQC